ncbi:MAG: di-trans,poly-cis-decaprenylcistransferase [Oscillospiraceae bacterium]|jgi:undecaprenyl diphosphate synthase|nr:di-trans,poly-cis-decaprenylcistransferase [Oscillospiraceae bacterium]
MSLLVHVGIIMDGNGRWARARGMPREYGHIRGVKTFRRIVKYAFNNTEIKYLTVYAFSTENWKRSKHEVAMIMNLLKQQICSAIRDYDKEIKINFLGDISGLPDEIRDLAMTLQEMTRENVKMTLNIALNYGSRSEILQAVKKILKSEVDPLDITESLFSSYLYTTSQPDPDLIIRTGGEMRLSNFLLWQAAYAEIWCTKVLWPDFSPNDFDEATQDYFNRKRKFGA